MDKENKISRHSKSFKRLFAALCITAVVTTGSLMAVTANAVSSPEITASTTAYLNVRSNAGTNYSVLQCIGKNTNVTIIDKINNNWVKVKTSNGLIGYCHADYLDIKTDAKTNTYLNLRQGPGTNYRWLKTIPVNTKLDILRFYNKSWMKVRCPDGTTGYVCTDYDYVSYIAPENTNSSGSDKTKSTSNSSTNKPATTTSAANAAAPKLSVTSKALNIGQSFTLTASGDNLVWKTSNENVAKLNNGQITGVSAGTAVITVTDSKTSKSTSCNITVNVPKITGIKLSSNSGTLTAGQTFQLNPSVSPASCKCAFKSSDGSVAGVSASGLITAKSAGICNITAYDPNGSSVQAVYKLTVKAKEVSKISLSNTSVTIKAGASRKITAASEAAVYWSSSNENIAAVRDGVISALAPGQAIITASSADGKSTAKCTVTVTAVESGGLTLTRTSDTITAGKTLYIQGNSSNKIWWNVSDSNIISVNTDVSTVNKGFIVAKNPGKAAVTYTDANGHRAICVITVKEAEPVKFTYSSPNSAVKDSDVKLIAITDKNRSDVYFEVQEGNRTVKINADHKESDGNTYVWTGTYHTNNAGTFTYAAYAKTGSGKYLTCNDGKADIYVTDKSNAKTTSLEKLRASDEMIRFIGEKEGFVPNVVPDVLANNIPTIAHGYVVWNGDKFYNGLTRNEGYALLVSAVNKENYTRDVNNMLINNNISFNQQQFDALVSFSYNLGTGWTYSSGLKNILLNSYTGLNSSETKAVVEAYGGLNLRESYTTNSKILETMPDGDTVTIIDDQKYNSVWYKVRSSSGKTGYCSGTYLNILEGSGSDRDLNYVNKNALIKEMLAYHHAGNVCYYGLLYRRADELEMFLYGDYISDGRSNKYNFPSPYCLSF